GAKVLARPVSKLSKIMDGIKSHGDLEIENQYVELKDRRDEIGELQKSFLWMLQRLREADREHKKTVEVLSQTEKMVAIGRLAAGVAHEINNPLSGMTLCFKNLMEADVDNLTREKLVLAINDGLQKIKNIVGHLLDFSRMTVTEKTPVDLNNLINRLLVLLNYPASKKNIEIINDLSDDISEILIDENKMSQVFMNIMINAVQAMDDGGRLTIRTKADDGFCVVSIEDTGAGISPDIMSRIFDPFFTTKGIGEGTGLGLSVSKGIVEQHGGMIEVDSEAGAGTTFKIKLPLV
ncbi:MAG: ATP-binding protein, partial [Nitrospirota bacterium]